MSWIRRHIADRRSKRGQTLVIFALVFVTLVGFAGLALDATHLYLMHHTAQKAADAAALAAGKRLSGATYQAPPTSPSDPAMLAAHDYAAADGFITGAVGCPATTTSGSLTRYTVTWTDGTTCSSTTYTNKVTVSVPPLVLTPHCQVTPYNCVQVTIQSNVSNFVMGTAGIPISAVQAFATVFAQPSGTTFSYPFPVAVYLYQPSVVNIAACPAGQQCFDRTKIPARTLMSCSIAGSNCPTYWARPEASNLIVGVDGTTLNPPQDVVALESNGDMVLQGAIGDEFCDPNGVGVAGCNLGQAIGTQGYALAPGANIYCSNPGGAGIRVPTPCTNAGPGAPTAGSAVTPLYGNETSFASHSWSPIVDTSSLNNCGGLLLNGNTVASGLTSSTCAPAGTDPEQYSIRPGKYDYIVINHGTYTFEPGIYDITGNSPTPVNTNNSLSAYATGIDHSGETAADWDLCTTAAGNPLACTTGATKLVAGVWIGHGKMNSYAAGVTQYGSCGGASTQLGGGGDQTVITGHGVFFRFEGGGANPNQRGFVSTNEVQSIGMTSPGLGQMREISGAPLLFDLENDSFIHIDASIARGSDSRQLNQYSGIIYQYSNAKAGGVEINPGFPTRFDGEGGGTQNNAVVGQIYAYSYTSFGQPGAFDWSNGAGGAATPTVATSGQLENSILTSSILVPGPVPGTESLVVKYVDEWALDAYDVYVKVNEINSGHPVYFSDGIWNPRPGGGTTLPPNGGSYNPSDTMPNEKLPLASQDLANLYTHAIDSNGDPDWTMTYPKTGPVYGNADGSTFRIDGDWAWGHERDLSTAVRGNDFATLTYTFPVPNSTTVTISMFMTDGDRCGDYVTSTWTFNNVSQPSPGVQIVGSVRLEQ